MPTALAPALALGSTAALAAAADSAGSSSDVLVVTIGGVLVSAVTAIGAVLAARGKSTPSVRYVDPPTSNALPQALSELYEDAIERAVRAEQERDAQEHLTELWRSRALERGWTG